MKSTDLALRIYDALGDGDVDALASLCTPDVEWIQNEGFPYGGHHRGAAAVIEGVGNTLRRHWDGFRFSRDEAYDVGNTAVYIGAYSGLHRATGNHVHAAAVHVFEFEDGLLRRFRQFTDTQLIHTAATSFSSGRGGPEPDKVETSTTGGVADIQGIIAAIELYLKGARSGESSIMRLAFHEEATIHAALDGVLTSGPIQSLYDRLDQNGPAANLHAKIVSIEVGVATAQVTLELSDWRGSDFTDRFLLSKERGTWRLASKIYEKRIQRSS